MPYPPRIALVGPPGAGKTTFGRALADALDYELIDLDTRIEQRAGRSIPELFAERGEAAFRFSEAAMLRWALTREQVVIATGGGCILRADNRRRLKEQACTVHMTLPEPQLWERLSRSRHRPLLQTENPRARLQQLLKERGGYYKQVAALTVSRPSVSGLLDRIIRLRAPRT